MRFRHGFHPFAHDGREHGHDHRGHGHGRGHGGWRRGGRSGRFFDQGDLRLVILALLAERPRHGYEIIKEIEDRLGGGYSPSPGVVYPTLTLLEELGQAELVEGGGAKKLYTATEAGREFLEQSKAQIEALFARMEEAGPGRDFAPRIMRAMGNVKLALRLKLASGPVSAEQVDRIAAALDAAALEIERS